ncbi:hypothetical protein BGW36DRAFT_299234 [Talaromyces proteolyticus]|uniref:Uncharacterized protein n=1 Tax=Talaromyces proteolyticus TaxID=1131652 RepID=A0AAD4KTP7_9EURO|nr:uncharacterized protein BGW36DRAFT_299234 [Talaromyces proteolyticus]KAH8695690.1 hypothetical protein BGW36DRAFT_299234 [Talaromyces proteolyticus]
MSYSRLGKASSSQTASAFVGFLGLPIEIRNNIYKQVLVVPHPLYIFQDSGSRVEMFAPEIPCRWLALLYTNKQISDEARAVLYGNNHFTLMETTNHLLESFLVRIGHVNASLLSHLCINFPTIERIGQLGEIRPTEDSLRSLQLLQQECTNLKALEALIYSPGSSDLINEDQNTQFIRDVLTEIDVRFRGIACLNKIIVRFYTRPPNPSVTELMQELGWVVLAGDG